jgi:hypothetical protein
MDPAGLITGAGYTHNGGLGQTQGHYRSSKLILSSGNLVLTGTGAFVFLAATTLTGIRVGDWIRIDISGKHVNTSGGYTEYDLAFVKPDNTLVWGFTWGNGAQLASANALFRGNEAAATETAMSASMSCLVTSGVQSGGALYSMLDDGGTIRVGLFGRRSAGTATIRANASEPFTMQITRQER